jgi:hypothetical protein
MCQWCTAQAFQVSGGEQSGADSVLLVEGLHPAPTEARCQWSVLEQELLGCFHAVKRWAPMLLGARFTILTDHKNILQLHKSVVPKIVRSSWKLQMQPFEYYTQAVKHCMCQGPGSGPRAENVVADSDCLSRLHGKSQRAIVSSSAVFKLLPDRHGDGSYAHWQDGEFEPDRATVELIRSY